MKKEELLNDHHQARLLDAKSLGEILSLSKRQVFRLMSAGLLPKSVKLSGARRWISDDVTAWIRSGCPDRETWDAMKMQAESY
jgi:prophage regulatory protein